MPDLLLIAELSERALVLCCERMSCFHSAFSWRGLGLTKTNLTRHGTVCDVFYDSRASVTVVVLKDFHVVIV